MTVASCLPCQCKMLTGHSLESCWSRILGETIPGRRRLRDDELEERQVLAARTGWRNSTEARGLLDPGQFCCLHEVPAGKSICVKRQSINLGPCAMPWRAVRAGGGRAQSKRAHSIAVGTEHPAKGNRCMWFPQSLPPPPPPQPQIKPGMFIDLNTIVPTMAGR